MKYGKLTVITGPMYSGKTSKLISEVGNTLELGLKPLVVKPIIDNRYSVDDIKSHDDISLKNMTGLPVMRLHVDDFPSLNQIDGIDILFIDEVQFFNKIGNIIDAYLNLGIHVVAVGLDMDSDGKAFGSMPLLLIKADEVVKLKAKCSVCGEEATRTFRKKSVDSKEQILIGGTESYEARCYKHWKDGN